jgi:hypothetical protein
MQSFRWNGNRQKSASNHARFNLNTLRLSLTMLFFAMKKRLKESSLLKHPMDAQMATKMSEQQTIALLATAQDRLGGSVRLAS